MAGELVEAYRQWLAAPLRQRDSLKDAMTHIALRELTESLPPAGPDPVELEVQGFFPEPPLQALPGHVRVINGRRVTRGRAVKRSKRRKAEC